MKPVRFLNPAEQEMLDAARYYELQAPGLGDGFLDKIDSAVRDIAENPETWSILRFEIHRRLYTVSRMPFFTELIQTKL